MKKKLISTLAAAVLSASVLVSDSGCTHSRNNSGPEDSRAALEEIVDSRIAEREAGLRADLRDVIKSVRCVRATSNYRLKVEEGETVPDSLPREREYKSYGTAFAYHWNGTHTSLVTNDHVVADHPDTAKVLGVDRVDGRLRLKIYEYERISPTTLTLVDNHMDENPVDDVPVERVRGYPHRDIHVIQADRELYVTDRVARQVSFEPQVGHELYIVGYPLARDITVTRGIVSNTHHVMTREDRDDFIGEMENDYYLGDANMTFGNSGSPVLVRQGDQLYLGGLVSMTWPYPRSMTNMFGIYVPLKHFNGLLDGASRLRGRSAESTTSSEVRPIEGVQFQFMRYEED